VNPVNVFSTLTKVLAEGKGVSVRNGLKGWSEAKGEPQARVTKGSGNPERKAMSRRTETAYKARSPGKFTQHKKAQMFAGQGDNKFLLCHVGEHNLLLS
jgi:hypothetical protein